MIEQWKKQKLSAATIAVVTAFLKKMEPKLNVPRLNKCNNPIILHILR